VSEVVFVGTSDAFGSGGRRQSAYLLRARSGAVLLDCGATTGTGLAALGIPRQEVDAIVVSHFHGDHFGGIPLFLLACLYQDSRHKPLRIAGPPQTEARVRRAAAALGHPIEGQEWSFPIVFQELTAGVPTPVGPVEVESFETLHSPDSNPHGLSVRTGSQRVVYSGDTGWFDTLPHHANGADLFICECTLVNRSFEYHLSLEDMSLRRGEFDCGRLVLTHLGEEMRSLTDFEGFEVADDGLTIKL
jgi:ribonuclease BN (tRNA processing enzyme)